MPEFGSPFSGLVNNRKLTDEKNMRNIIVATFVILVLFSGTVRAQDNIEKKKIEFLISSVENLKEAKFIRNGLEYNGLEAAAHLRMKLQNVLVVETADDFIRLCASKSSVSGKPYLIRLSNGKTIKSEEYLRAKLKEYR
jgi:Ran GTPase-activating protein (RanGAP) involved in mRNA processing and transport